MADVSQKLLYDPFPDMPKVGKYVGYSPDSGPVVPDGVMHRGPRDRIPFSIVTENEPNALYQFWVNPSECQWSIATRTMIEKVAGGAIHHEWPAISGLSEKQKPSKFDQPVIRFAFQSGIVVPYRYQDLEQGGAENRMPPGLGNFYDFLQLLNEPNLTKVGTPNYIHILYVSSTFPSLHLMGFFTPEGVSWTDSADNPYQINSWGASFEVFSSEPDLSSSSSLRTMFRQFGYKGTFPKAAGGFNQASQRSPSNPI